MDDSKEAIKNFAVSFFTNLKCNLEWQNGILRVSNVPKDFEDFFGRKSPYNLAFDGERENTELMTKGSFLIKVMNNYLENRGQATLLKVDIPSEMTDIKSKVNLFNSEIYGLNKKHMYRLITRFTFLTTFQYLNEKEQLINHIYIENGKKVEFDLAKWPAKDGKKDEIGSVDVKSDYSVAKDNLKSLLNLKINQISDLLNSKLDKEITRINEHFSSLIKEIELEMERNRTQVKELENQLARAKNPEDKKQSRLVPLTEEDVKNINLRITKLKENIERLKNDPRREKIEKERKFFLNDEEHKHGLNVDNKLINTTLIYYPIYSLKFNLRNEDSLSSDMIIGYDPVEDKFDYLKCESCHEQIKDIILCCSGHISCKKCSEKCGNCNRFNCKLCKINSCDKCSKKVCKKCLGRCQDCSKSMCIDHMRKNANGKYSCLNCIGFCGYCSSSFSKKELKRCPGCGREGCGKCIMQNTIKSGGKIMCIKCSRKCTLCGDLKGNDSFSKFRDCDCRTCNDLTKCSECRKRFCPRRNVIKA